MTSFHLRSGTLEDTNDIVKLNSDVENVTSPMDAGRFRELFQISSLTAVAEDEGRVVGFLMGLNDGVACDGVNYQWFAMRLKKFFYIDRIVIENSCRGSGLGRKFYAHVATWARGQGQLWLAAEMDLDPPNVPSLRFHERQGFRQIGTQTLPSGKLVSMQVRAVD